MVLRSLAAPDFFFFSSGSLIAFARGNLNTDHIRFVQPNPGCGHFHLGINLVGTFIYVYVKVMHYLAHP